MKKLIYISGEDFFDVDFPILKELTKQYDLTWIPILRKNGWYSNEDITSFCETHHIKVLPILQKYKYKHPMMVLFYIRLLSTIRKLNSDIIYFEYFGVPYLHFFSPFFLDKKKLVFAIHDVEQHYKMSYGNLKSFYFNHICQHFVNFHVFSEVQAEIFRKKYPGKNVFVAKLYLKDFGAPTIRKANDGKVHFLFFGIIRKNKGLDLIIKAFNEVAKKRTDFIVTIAGNTKDWAEYDALIDDKRFYHLMIRKIKNEEIPNLFIEADYSLLLYIDVTQSGVLLTSYNYNVPVIASDLPGFHEYVTDGYNGFLVTPNVEAIAKKIEKIIEEHSNIHNIMSSNLKGYIEEHINLNKIIQNYCDFFNSL